MTADGDLGVGEIGESYRGRDLVLSGGSAVVGEEGLAAVAAGGIVGLSSMAGEFLADLPGSAAVGRGGDPSGEGLDDRVRVGVCDRAPGIALDPLCLLLPSVGEPLSDFVRFEVGRVAQIGASEPSVTGALCSGSNV